ncbi:hypothetical protein MKW98_015906, partial [Papaver atlanticum]
MSIQLQPQDFTTVELEDRPASETQPILMSSDRSDDNMVVNTSKRRCKFTSRASVWYISASLAIFLVATFVVASTKWKRPGPPPIRPPDEYSIALKKALLFFDSQM